MVIILEDFEYFEGWNKVVRWILFVPMVVITYTLVYLIGRWIIWSGYGWVGINEESVIGYIIYGFHINFICFFISFTVSVACAPKGRIIIASIYLGLILFSLGFSTLSVITYGDFNGTPNWVVIYNYVLNFIALLWVLIMVIADENKKKKELNDIQVDLN